MTSFYYASTSTRGNWFQTNQPEHDSDDRTGDVVYFCVLPLKMIWHFTGKFDQHLSLYYGAVNQNYRRDRDIGSCEGLVRYDLQNLLTILA